MHWLIDAAAAEIRDCEQRGIEGLAVPCICTLVLLVGYNLPLVGCDDGMAGYSPFYWNTQHAGAVFTYGILHQ